MKTVFDEIKPSEKERKALLFLAKKIMNKIKIPKAKPMLGGSAAKNTFLKGAHDIDIYVRFDMKKYKDKDISKILEKELKNKFAGVEDVHGSRDYFQMSVEGYEIEVIPIIKIRKAKQALNITDVSPLHVKFVKKYKKYSDDIRLAKAFCKANGIYGAESYIKGFSGYVIEILTIYYKGFENLLKASKKWKAKEIVDFYGKYKRKNILKEMNISKLTSPMIIVDPVQMDRNAGAGIGKEKFSKFISLAKNYLKKPSNEFFFKKKITIDSLKERKGKNHLFIIAAAPVEGKRDVVGAKLLKVFEYIKKNLRSEGFELKESGWLWDGNGLMWFIIDKKKLSALKKHYGPPKKSKERMKNFKKRWRNKKIYSEKGISYIKVKREFREAPKLMRKLLKSEYIKERVLEANLKKF